MATNLPTISDLVVDIEPISHWHDVLLPRLTGADTDAINIELGNAVNDFLRYSTAFYVEYPLKVDAESYEYKIDISFIPTRYEGVLSPSTPLFTIPLQVFSVEFANGYPIKVIDVRPFIRNSGQPRVAFFKSPLLMELYPYPNKEYDLIVKTPLKLRLPITHVPVILTEQYYDAILYGTLARMLMHPKRPYSDPMTAQAHLNSYKKYVAMARDEMRKGWANAETSFSYPAGWDVSRART